MTDLLRRLEPGRAAFNRGAYFEAHELWEDVWRELEGDARIVVQGLIQIAAGLHHLGQQRPGPAAGLLRKGLSKVQKAQGVPAMGHLPVAALADAVADVLATLEAKAEMPDAAPLRL